MKIRNGFVSNSSSSSFTIYGWTSQELSNYIIELMPIFEDVELSISMYEYALVFNLEKYWKGDKWELTHATNSQGDFVFGLGKSGEEVDHYNDNFANDFAYDEPSIADQRKFKKIAKKLKLPAPTMHQETFYE